MAQDIFCSEELFDQFEQPANPSDKILMTKFKNDESPVLLSNNDAGRNEMNDGEVKFHLNPSSESDDDSDLDADENGEIDREFPENETERDNNLQISGKSQNLKQSNGNVDESFETIQKLQRELAKVKQERDRLKQVCRLIDPSKYYKDEEGPAFQLLYMNNQNASKHRHTVEIFLANMMMQEYNKNNEDQHDKRLRHATVCLDDVHGAVPTPEEKIRQMRASTVIGCSQMYPGFCVDSMGWGLVCDMPMVSEGWDIPIYQQEFFVPLPIDEDEDQGPVGPSKSRPKASCWNCGEAHNLKDCPHPRNHKKIAEGRQKFQNNKINTPKQGRYHKDEEIDAKYAKCKPGSISKELMEAMGLTDRDIPPYVYQMRVLGYPPGHLKSLEEDNSGLSMFDKHGKDTHVEPDSGEDGEIEGAKEPLDVTKLIKYPGFNVPVERGVVDDYKNLGMQPMNPAQSLEMMSKLLTAQNRGVKRSHSDTSTPGVSRHKRRCTNDGPVSTDMDMSDSDEGGRSAAAAERSLSQDTDILSQSSQQDSVESGEVMSLEDLELQKQLLQEQLAMSEGAEADMQVVDSCEGAVDEELNQADTSQEFVPPLPPTPDRAPLPTNTPPRTPTGNLNRLESQTSSNAVFKTPDCPPRLLRTPSSGSSLCMSFGTPVLDDCIVEEKTKGLPEPSRFAEGITQHIPFENLPGATGSFDKMKNILDHIKSRRKSSLS